MSEKNGESSKAGARYRARMEMPPRQAEAGPSTSTQRKVRTVPPHAAFEPSTPPSPARPSNDSTLVNPVASVEPGNTRRERRRRPKLRYSTSESSYDDTDDESDEEPPWWTFTQRGMHKLKLRNMRLQQEGGAGQPSGNTDEEDRTDAAERGMSKSTSSLVGRRRQKKKQSGGDRSTRKSSGAGGGGGGGAGGGSLEPTPKGSLRNMRHTESPKPIRPPLALPPNMRMSTPSFLRSRKEGTGTPPIKIKMKRRYSAPSSPVPDVENIPSIALITSPTDGTGPSRPLGLHESLPIHPVSSLHSILSIPRPPFIKRHSESLTDTEAVASHSVRLKAKRAQTNVQEQDDSAAHPQESGTSTPGRRGKERKQTMSRLKINLSDQVTQHFSHGWPHAGTWQDALYGYYDEVPKDKDGLAADSRKSSKDLKNRSNSLPQHPPLTSTPDGMTTPGREAIGIGIGSDSASPAPRPRPSRRAKSRRRKYRQALAPPTPSGLGFTEEERGLGAGREAWKQGKVVNQEFDWGMNGHGHGNGNGHGHARITEESGELSRTETRQTMMEKGGMATLNTKVKPKNKTATNDGMDWKQRARRILFLDARLTIWIRFFNLAVAVCSLALAVTIRRELFALRLPGLIGPSTTLVIAYSSLTILHIFVAVYREYYGRPIGLWGLRSKMLWVCLDLLFVALWSSALTLQINDLIDTPLDCVPQTAWWEEGRSAEYAEVFNDLDILRANDANLQDLGVSETLGIILPDEITSSSFAQEACRRQAGGIALALLTLLLYGGNMVLSLFRIFETVRRTAHVDRAVMF